ncbi:dTDP-4-dehydrorhamnose reductase [Candidatus Uhrbacteria bacterium]|nr:dTDP-4-dehydrorhamnose reductase [Candidatus Uhrbacteria bacterium]
MKILITGAKGQLGTELADNADRQRHELILADMEEFDLTDKTSIGSFLEKTKSDLIINCAAFTQVDAAEADGEVARKVNADAPETMAAWCKENGARMIQISTDYVFSGNHSSPYSVDDLPDPQSAYGRTKLEGERKVLEADGNAIIIRTAWLYSPYGKNFVKTMLKLMAEREELKVVGDQIGSPTSAADLARAILKIMELDGVRGIFHFTNEGVASWYDLAQAIAEYSGSKCRVLPIKTEEYPTPAKRPAYSVLDKSKIKELIGPIRHWREALKDSLGNA